MAKRNDRSDHDSVDYLRDEVKPLPRKSAKREKATVYRLTAGQHLILQSMRKYNTNPPRVDEFMESPDFKEERAVAAAIDRALAKAWERGACELAECHRVRRAPCPNPYRKARK